MAGPLQRPAGLRFGVSMCQPFKRFVETGRVAYIAEGPHQGKLCSIVDVIDQTRALIDGPETGVPRSALRLNQLHLTKFSIRFPYTAGTRVVRKAWKDGKIDEKWKQSVWFQKVEAKKKRAELTDFDRFKLRYARRMRNKIRSRVFHKLKATRGGRPKGAKGEKKAKAPKKAAPKKK